MIDPSPNQSGPNPNTAAQSPAARSRSTEPDMDLPPGPEQRVVLITGASSGIGLAAALQAAERGDRLALLGRNAETLESVENLCQQRGATAVLVLPADVTDAAAVQAAVDRVLATWDRIDVTLQSAGVAGYGLFTQMPAEVFDRIIATNLLGTANVIRSVLPSLRARDSGTVIVMGSIIGYIATPMMSAYTTSKWAMRGLVRTLQVENRDRPGVSICYLAPAGVDTPIYRRAANYSDRNGQPPPPVLSPEKVAAAALRLADRPRRSEQVGAANLMVMTGFALLPGVYDRLVTPLFRRFATRGGRVGAGVPGNLFSG
ncbi:MAG TPA: SDR family NAD(P)-dependent oxidoreductase [Propionibacteriaceae bacterium]|nr:SDR family NAD(P)-dependent oxidoreductase [Propionibacteriaceae bacterium]